MREGILLLVIAKTRFAKTRFAVDCRSRKIAAHVSTLPLENMCWEPQVYNLYRLLNGRQPLLVESHSYFCFVLCEALFPIPFKLSTMNRC
jgi:hypothetical protein